MVEFKFFHIVTSIDLSSGGPSKSVSDLLLAQTLRGLDVKIVTKPSENLYLTEEDQRVVFSNNIKSKLKSLINENAGQFLFHGHGLWQSPIHFMASLANKNQISYVISPRGMLEPWAYSNGIWKKKIAMALYQRSDLANAACIHATAKMEAENIRKLGFTNPIAVIPNGIDVAEFPKKDWSVKKERRTLLFLSRIHPKKGIELLIQAWEQLPLEVRYEWKVEIAGNGEETYISELKNLIVQKKLQDEIKIIGPQFGEEKIKSYHRADLFILPTYSENFGIVVAEALACGVPVVTTKGAPWEELEKHGAGWWIDVGVKPIVNCLKNALLMDNRQLCEMGQKGRKLIQEHYSIEKTASQMIEVYSWILNKGEKPSCLYR
ncbi:glycosyltransferase [Echinicola rosea]|uniref:Glycosyl transferase family 1 n=1 Tax=Echinicola rosea TaxID=1807691 RepID=A0ABQ1UZZ3_9BACT|nr:glycosyltransferase [Echinicola rosea]GGF31842.1 glycosyl transferase family 1 [Echinicola rosea]